MKKILIVKTSSLGDIVQTFGVLEYLHRLFPSCCIDWVVDERFYDLVASHPFIHRAIAIDLISWKEKPWKVIHLLQWKQELQKTEYDLLFDLQGNCKSALLTFLAKSKEKIGFSLSSVSEWPNILVMTKRFCVSSKRNMRLQYLELVQKYFQDSASFSFEEVLLKISFSQQEKIRQIVDLAPSDRVKVMICPGSRWKNKQLPLPILKELLALLQKEISPFFFLVWGSEEEKRLTEELFREFPSISALVNKLTFASLQHLMKKMDFVIAMDSFALHLCGTLSVPSFSIFGPTKAELFCPIGPYHHAVQGICPRGQVFKKRCSFLHKCSQGSCICSFSAQELLQSLRPILSFVKAQQVVLNFTKH